MSGKKEGKKAQKAQRNGFDGTVRGDFSEKLERAIKKGTADAVEHGIRVEARYRRRFEGKGSLNSGDQTWYKGSTEVDKASVPPDYKVGDLSQPVMKPDVKERRNMEQATNNFTANGEGTHTTGRTAGEEAAYARGAADGAKGEVLSIWAKIKGHLQRNSGKYGVLLGVAGTMAAQATVATVAKRSGFRGTVQTPDGQVITTDLGTNPQPGAQPGNDNGAGNRTTGRGR